MSACQYVNMLCHMSLSLFAVSSLHPICESIWSVTVETVETLTPIMTQYQITHTHTIAAQSVTTTQVEKSPAQPKT